MREVEREGQRAVEGEQGREKSTGTKRGREGRGMGIARRCR